MARDQRGDRGGFRRYFTPRRKVCRFCQRNVRDIDYKNVDILKRYILERGKISPRRPAHVLFISGKYPLQ
jgi:small subunit ribosomal protein S18